MAEEKGPLEVESDDIPDWLNSGYFEQLLRKKKEDSSIRVQSLDVKYAIPRGENFVSVIYRVQVVFETKDEKLVNRSYIVKGISTSEFTVKKLGEGGYNVYEKEMDVYERIIPELSRLAKSLGERSELYPSTLTIDRDNNVIIFDDLKRKGFVMGDRKVGLNRIELEMSFKLMAMMHASSLKLAEMQPTIFDGYSTGMITRDTDAFYVFYYSTLDALVDEISTWESEWHYYSNKLRKLRPHFMEQGISVFEHKNEDDLRVLVHGDLWINNMMFKYDSDGTATDVVLLDFQFCCYTTPVVDLCFLFFCSANDELRQTYFEELMQSYYNHLANYAKRLGCSKKFPTSHQFQRQLLSKLFYAIFCSVIALPVQINEDSTDADFEGVLGSDEKSARYRRTIMANPRYHKIIKGLLPFFDRKGLLDKLE
uniref:Putative ecdysteroid kinase n=1 Tax=Culex tarsalis TaxID=7177 RepID=A0A1Q3FKR9_CULTA